MDSTQSLKYISYKNYQFCPKKDKYGRTIGNSIKTTNSTIEESRINYCKLAANSSNRISSIYYANNGITNTNIKCSYDSMGNVTKITTDGKLTVRYTYDALSRVIREDNKELNKTILIAYDDCGNILNKISTPFTLGYPEEQEIITESKYQYNKDVLVNYNGSAISYDNIGNPLAVGSTTLSWTLGTLLAKYGNNTFTYDAIGFTYNSNDYFYRRDVLGNIINIIDSNGNNVIQYKYDAWGNHEIFDSNNNLITDLSNIGYINPIRYKGYYFDVETGLYYCMARYYSPQMGRWISPDSIEYLDPKSMNGLNLYAYCGNNPVMMVDPDGHWAMPNWLKWVIVGLGIATIATGGAAAGVAGFIVAGALKGAVIGAVSGVLIGGTIGGISSSLDGNGFWSGFADGAADGFMSGAIVVGITGALGNAIKVGQTANFWDKGNFKSGFRSMKYHYKTYVLDEGFKAGNNIVKYTKDGVSFASKNANSLKFIVPYNTALQPHWTFIGKVGMNGQFTSVGKILTFWYTAL